MMRAWLAILLIGCTGGASGGASGGDPAGDDPGSLPYDLPDATVGESHDAPPPSAPPLVVAFDGEDHGDDACHGIAGLPGGGFVITGETRRIAEGRNAFSRAYSPTGSLLWTHELHTPSEGSDAGRGVVALPGGNVAVAGSWYSGSDSRTNYFTATFSPSGAVLDLDEGELVGDDSYTSVAADASGNLVLAGVRGGQAYVRAGDRTLVRGTDAAAARVVIANNGDLLVAGREGAGGFAARYHDGVEIAALRFETPATDIAALPSGFAVAAGAVQVFDDAGALRFEIPGTWRAVAAHGSGVVVAGTDAGNLVVRSYAADGAEGWTRSYPSGTAASVTVAADGSVLVCGTQSGANPDALAILYR